MKASDQVYSKVILSGEHSVLRGGLAVVAPLKTHSLKYKFLNAESCRFIYTEETAPFEILIEGTFEKALKLLEKTRGDLGVETWVESLVPLGKGLGGSAALCVFISRLMVHAGFMKKDRIFQFSIELENMFHGESSGVDIAGCLSDGPQSYIRGERLKQLKTKASQFVFGLSETGEIGETEECIENVLDLKRRDKNKFHALDADMNKASTGIAKALELGDTNMLMHSFDLARAVFFSWGLVTPIMKAKIDKLKENGALSSKPTGSGMGGYILSVWDFTDLPKAQKCCEEIFTI